ncbi:translation initiation factor IF-2 [Methylogaea oryzae]|uniref:Translation initiation factor IF-2 n=2 Tax=Methylogaea oryzae TaxID=1295382 RepID=A0A8D5AGS0_9GAMM|nr:translation initiation factor IF-2 [Methylogaea oryzae]BBL70678.1 translation initiation factor IF-2 [Methylogaea oryzae]
MSNLTVRQLAEVVGIPVDRLLTQLEEAGLPKSGADDELADAEKMQLLSYLRQSHGKGQAVVAEPKKVTLKRRTVSELKQGGAPGQGAKVVSVEVRKQRTYVKRSELPESGDKLAEIEKAQQELEEKQRALEAEAQEAQRRREQEAAAAAAKKAEEAAAQSEAASKAEEVAPPVVETPPVEPVAPPPPAAAPPKVSQPAPAPAAPKEADPRKSEPARPGKKKPAEYGKSRVELRESESALLASKRAGLKKKKGRGSDAGLPEQRHGFERPTAPMVHEVNVPEAITVADLAQRMSVKGVEVVKALLKMGVMATINQTIDQDTAAIVVTEMGHVPKLQSEDDLEAEIFAGVEEADAEQLPRAPVVTIMGHVDHGKTSLLDYIRKSRVAAGEAGGITQHIGAYQVKTDHGAVTFLDTPGHAAFTAMRARGAKITDIVVLVVAADDGVMPQTKEAVEHARAAGVPLVVALNKMDKQGADPDRVKQELVALEVVPEEWGGDTQFVPVSAKTGSGVPDLIEAILIQSEVLELKAPVSVAAGGVVLESKLEKGRGPVADVLVQRGLLKKGDFVLCGKEFGRVRAMFDENGKPAKDAGPCVPVEILGLSGAPNAGDEFVVVADERKAREIATQREERSRASALAAQQAAKLGDVFERLEASAGSVDLNLIVKADVQGSLEALRGALSELSGAKVRVRVISGGVGGITESDANLALASNAIVIGFNVRADAGARKLIEEKGIDLHYYSVIYHAIDEIKKAITGLMAPEYKEQIVGIAEVREVFRHPKFGDIAGCLVLEGYVKRSLPIRVLRNNVVIFEGQLESLRRFKDDVNEVKSGMECGIGVKDYNNVKAGDQIEVFERIEVTPTQ